MAENLDIRENQLEQRTAAYLRCIDSAGNSGLVAPGTVLGYLAHVFKQGGLQGGGVTTWVGLGTFGANPYQPIRIDIITGVYNASTKNHIDLVITVLNKVSVSGQGINRIGYVLRGAVIDIYLKVTPGDAYNGWILGNFINAINATTTEPSGIVYVP